MKAFLLLLLFLLITTFGWGQSGTPIKLSQFPELPEAPNGADWVYIWDLSANTSKKVSVSNFFKAMPPAGASTLGGVKRNVGASGEFVSGIDSAGNLVYGTPATGGGSIGVTGIRVPYGNGLGSLTSEGGFEYNAAQNQLVVPNINLSGEVRFGTDNVYLSAVTPGQFSITYGGTGDELAFDFTSDNNVRVFSGSSVGSINFDGINLLVPDDAYNEGTWNGNRATPTKDALRDKFETLVTKVGTTVNNQIGVWTGDGTLEGNPQLTFDASSNTFDTQKIVASSWLRLGSTLTFFESAANTLQLDTSTESLTVDLSTANNVILGSATGINIWDWGTLGMKVQVPTQVVFTAMTGNTVDLTKPGNKQSISGNVTWALSGSLVEGQSTEVQIKNTSTGSVTVTMPVSPVIYDANTGTAVTSLPVPAQVSSVPGRRQVCISHDGTNYILFQGGGSGGSGDALLAANNIFTGATNTFNGDVSVGGDASVAGNFSALTLSGALDDGSLPATMPARIYETITTSRSRVYTPTAAVGNTIVTTNAHTVFTADGATEAMLWSGTPPEGSQFRVTLTAHPSLETTFSFPGTPSPPFYSVALTTNRSDFKLPAAGFVTFDVEYRAGAYIVSGEPVYLMDYPDAVSPTSSFYVEIGNPTTGVSGKRTVANIVADAGAKLTRTGVRRTVYIPANGMIPRTTNGAAVGTAELATNDIMVPTRDFDQTTEEGVGFWWSLPPTFNGSTVTAKFHWTTTAGTAAEAVAWNIAARGYADGDDLDQALGTEQAVVDTLTAVNKNQRSATSPAISIGGDNTAGAQVYFQITRDVGNDDLAADAKLIGVTLEYTESSTEPSAQ